MSIVNIQTASCTFDAVVKQDMDFAIMTVEPIENGQTVQLTASNVDSHAFCKMLDTAFLTDKDKMEKLFFAITGLDPETHGANLVHEIVTPGDNPVVKIGLPLSEADVEAAEEDLYGILRSDDGTFAHLLLTPNFDFDVLPDDWQGCDAVELCGDIESPEAKERLLAAFPELQKTVEGHALNSVTGTLQITDTHRFVDGKFETTDTEFPLADDVQELFTQVLSGSLQGKFPQGVPPLIFYTAHLVQMELSQEPEPEESMLVDSIVEETPYLYGPLPKSDPRP